MNTTTTRLALMVIVVMGWSLSAIAQNTTSTIRGRVVGARSQVPLQGVVVAFRGASLIAATDQKGEYLLVPSGAQTLEVGCPGFESLQRKLSLTAGSTSTVNFVLGPAQRVAESISVVSGPEGIARYECGDGGYWVLTDQHPERTRFHVIEREVSAISDRSLDMSLRIGRSYGCIRVGGSIRKRRVVCRA